MDGCGTHLHAVGFIIRALDFNSRYWIGIKMSPKRVLNEEMETLLLNEPCTFHLKQWTFHCSQKNGVFSFLECGANNVAFPTLPNRFEKDTKQNGCNVPIWNSKWRWWHQVNRTKCNDLRWWQITWLERRRGDVIRGAKDIAGVICRDGIDGTSGEADTIVLLRDGDFFVTSVGEPQRGRSQQLSIWLFDRSAPFWLWRSNTCGH